MHDRDASGKTPLHQATHEHTSGGTRNRGEPQPAPGPRTREACKHRGGGERERAEREGRDSEQRNLERAAAAVRPRVASAQDATAFGRGG